MSDEIRVTRDAPETGARSTGGVRPTGADAARQTPAEANAGTGGIPQYDDPEVARAEIEATRNRMSETINEIEDVLVRRKERIQNKLDVLSPIKEHPWPAMGIALGAGILFGLLTGGDDDEHEVRRGGAAAAGPDWERRAGMLHSRTHRLLDIARDQEDELRRLRRKHRKHRRSESLLDHFSGDGDDEDEGLLDTIGSSASELRETLGSTASDWRDALGSRANDWRETIGSTASDWRSSASDLRETIAERLSDFLDNAVRQMKRRR